MKLPEHSLFLKIFIWFWLAMILINVALFAAVAITRPTPTGRSWRDLTMVSPNAQKAGDTYDQGGSAALAIYLREAENSSGINAVFFDDNGQELSGRVTPAGASELAAKATKSGDTEFNFAGRNTLVAKPVATSQGHHYIYIANIPRTPYNVSLRTQGLRLLAVLLTGGILCYLLARALTN